MRQHLTTSTLSKATKLSTAAGVLFMAASSVYADQAPPATPVTPANQSAANSPLLDNTATTRPAFSVSDAAPTTQPLAGATAPASPEAVDVAPERPANPINPSDVNVSADTGTVEIHVNDASLVEVLKMISMQSQKNIVASKDVHGTITANLYDVTIPEALDAILTANGYAYQEKGNFIYVYTRKELDEIERAERKRQTEAFRLFYTPAANVVPLIKPALSSDPPGEVSYTTAALSGLDTTGTMKDTGGLSHSTEDMIVVTDYPENLAAVKKILQEVDKRPQEILVEATILRASLNEDNALGIDFNVLAGAKFNNILSNTGGQITGANSQGGTTAGGTGAGAGGTGATGGSSGATPFANDSNRFGSVGTGNNFTNSVNGGLKLGFISDNVSVFLAALEGITDTSVLANPKVLALNKQQGQILVGRSDGYITTTVSQTTSTQTVDFLETGTKLSFRPFIGNDGYIRMEIHPEDSTGGLNSSNLPFKVTAEVTSNIMVKDGHTIVIGGLFREATTNNRSQVPGLGNLPGAGYLFRNQHDTTDREEIIVLLTPHIIKDDDKYSQDSLDELKDASRIRVGIRQGLMPFGRERLAESCYECALSEWNKPHPDRSKVLWHLNCALNLNPKFLEAIKLKEKVTGQEVRASDNSSIRDFVIHEAEADRDIPPTHTPESVEITHKPAGPSTRPVSAYLTRPAKLHKAAPTTAPSVAEATTPAATPKPAGLISSLLSWLSTPADAAPPARKDEIAPAVAVTPKSPEPEEPIIPVSAQSPTTQPATTLTDVSLEEMPQK